jgi:sugar lactone lactonase YvrE
MATSSRHRALALALTAGLLGCQPLIPAASRPPAVTVCGSLTGRVEFPEAVRSAQAATNEIATGATISLIDATTGTTVATSLTDGGGNFVLAFGSLSPVTGSTYLLEAVKGLSVGGSPNRPGTKAARLRTLLCWNAGWQSFTNSTPNTGIVLSAATTALATIVSLRQQRGQVLSLAAFINTISGNTFTPAGGLTSAGDFLPVLQQVSNAIALDQDPLAAIGYDASSGTYPLATGVPWISGYSPAQPATGSVITVRGLNLDKLNGRNAFWFGMVQAATWSVSADRTTATMSVPANAYCAPFTMQQPNGVKQTIAPMLFIRGTVGTLAGGGNNGMAGYNDGIGAAAQFNYPSDVVLGADQTLYVTENRRVRKVTPGGLVTTLAGSSTVSGCTDGIGAGATFSGTAAMAMDAQGNVYRLDYSPWSALRKVTPTGVVTTLAGAGGMGYLDGPGYLARFNNPYGLCVLPNGDLILGDYANHAIRRVNPGGIVSTLAGTTVAGDANGTALAAQFRSPSGVVADSSGNIFVAESDGNRIRMISPAGNVTVFAGSPTAVAGSANGTGTAASFRTPIGLAIDSGNNLYVGDYANYMIRKITPAGVVTTVAGAGSLGYLDGATSSAQFKRPYGIALDASGNLYVADATANAIRVICP